MDRAYLTFQMTDLPTCYDGCQLGRGISAGCYIVGTRYRS